MADQVERLPRRSPLDHQRRRELMSAAAGALGDTVPPTPRLPEDACHVCDSTGGTLVPTTVPLGPGVVRDTVVHPGCEDGPQ